jgi:hypothetical protein
MTKPSSASSFAMGEFLSDRRAVAGADDSDDRNIGKMESALDVEKGRRRIDLGKRRRVARLTHRYETGAQALGGLELSLGFGFRAERSVRRGATAAAGPRWRLQLPRTR